MKFKSNDNKGVWIGYTLRKNVKDIKMESLEWDPQGKRNVGGIRGIHGTQM